MLLKYWNHLHPLVWLSCLSEGVLRWRGWKSAQIILCAVIWSPWIPRGHQRGHQTLKHQVEGAVSQAHHLRMKEKLCLLFWTQEVQNLQLQDREELRTSPGHQHSIEVNLVPSYDPQESIRCRRECPYPSEEHVNGREVSHLSHDSERAEVLHQPVFSAVLWIHTTYNNTRSDVPKTFTEHKQRDLTNNTPSKSRSVTWGCVSGEKRVHEERIDPLLSHWIQTGEMLTQLLDAIYTHNETHKNTRTYKESFTQWNEVVDYISLVSSAHCRTQSGRRCSWSFCCWDMWGSFWRWTTAEEWVWCPAMLWSRDPRLNWHLPTDPRPELRTHWSAARETISQRSHSSKGSWDMCVCVCWRTMNE